MTDVVASPSSLGPFWQGERAAGSNAMRPWRRELGDRTRHQRDLQKEPSEPRFRTLKTGRSPKLPRRAVTRSKHISCRNSYVSTQSAVGNEAPRALFLRCKEMDRRLLQDN
jgi:hypothetical protein